MKQFTKSMRPLILLSVLLATVSCKLEIPDTDKTQFATQPTATSVRSGQINNVSGLVDSRSLSGNLWAVQGSDTSASLSLLGYDGTVKNTLRIPRFSSRDWEDLSIGPGPNQGTNYLYIADTGDKNLQTSIYQIYRLPEPQTAQTTSTQIERINFRYPDRSSQDARAMLVDPLTKDIFIITSRSPNNAHLYRIAYPQNINEIAVAEGFGEIPIGTLVTGATISTDGSEIILRTYNQAIYWKRAANQRVDDVIQNSTGRPAPLVAEPKGEAICFDKDSRGYFSLSQNGSAEPVNLYYYGKQ